MAETSDDDSIHDAKSGRQIRRRASLLQQASSLFISLSQASLQRSLQALHQVSSFLGVSSSQSDLESWQHQSQVRADSGHIGINLSTLVPESNKNQTLAQALTSLQATLSDIQQRNGVPPMPEESSEKVVETTQTTADSRFPVCKNGICQHTKEVGGTDNEIPVEIIKQEDSHHNVTTDATQVFSPNAVNNVKNTEEVYFIPYEDNTNLKYISSKIEVIELQDQTTNPSHGVQDELCPTCQSSRVIPSYKYEKCEKSIAIEKTRNQKVEQQEVFWSASEHLRTKLDSIKDLSSNEDTASLPNIYVRRTLPKEGMESKKAPILPPVEGSLVSRMVQRKEQADELSMIGTDFRNRETVLSEPKEMVSLQAKRPSPETLQHPPTFQQDSMIDKEQIANFKDESTNLTDRPKTILMEYTVANCDQANGTKAEQVCEAKLFEQDLKENNDESPSKIQNPLNIVKTDDKVELIYDADSALEQYRQCIKNDAAHICFLNNRDLAVAKQQLEQDLFDLELALESVQETRTSGEKTNKWVKMFLMWCQSWSNIKGYTNSNRVKNFPYFIVFMSFIQIVSMVVLCSVGGLAGFGLEPILEVRHSVFTMRGLETVDHWILPNIWIGPQPSFLIMMGSFFAPCVRDDIGISLHYAKEGYSRDVQLGCCEVNSRNTAGTTTESQCHLLSIGAGIWVNDTICSERIWSPNLVPHNIRPCCYGLKGLCKMTSHEHCAFIEGTYHQFGPDHCSQVNCQAGICDMMKSPMSEPDMPYRSSYHNQHWRPLLALIYHQGALHVIPIIILQMLLGCSLETFAGHMRILLIYLTSGIMGLYVGSTFSPYLPHCGAMSAVSGLLTVNVMELIQSWKHVHNPCRELGKLLGVLALFIISGTLPYVDNFEVFGGMVFGGLSALILMPFLTFGRWQVMRRRALVGTSLFALLLLLTMVLYTFYVTQTVYQNCPGCKAINCVQYTPTVCKIAELW